MPRRDPITATRRLHINWAVAGERRLVARALFAAGFTKRHIGLLLGVSPTTVSKDVAE